MEKNNANKGLFDSKVIEAVRKRMANSRPIYPTKESILEFFAAIRKDFIVNKDKWDKLLFKQIDKN